MRAPRLAGFPDLLGHLLRRRHELPWLAAIPGGVVAVLGLYADASENSAGTLPFYAEAVIALGVGAAVSLYRIRPAWALALVWLTAVIQVADDLDIALVQLGGVLVVAYGTARHGRVRTVWAAGISIPTGTFLAISYLIQRGGTESPGVIGLVGLIPYRSSLGIFTGYAFALAPLLVPFTIGLLLRVAERYNVSTTRREQAEAHALRAEEIARLRAEQTRLAHDVHDVVGHSLAVIVAQADSAQSLGDHDLDRIREAMATISATARRSLGDVRQVLSSAGERAVSTGTTGTLESLVDGVRGAGYAVRDDVVGAPRHLPPDLDLVAYRVLQEMLTNALKHGERSTPVTVVRTWGADELRIQVCNTVVGRASEPAQGLGLSGMRQRLRTAGGTLHTVQRENKNGPSLFTATARIPTGR
ncbi:sensor histidine kinase [Streptomyces sp. NPDC051569]|uniref:sensor histidine kinase n=1 Tax=Streptomyces sp. NPDC051569 TaxID=3365661 RepID=UPI003795CA01